MRNPEVEELISAYLDGELSGEERSQVEQWLRDDAELRQLLEDFRALSRQFQPLRQERPSRDLTAAILSDPRVVQVAEERQRKAAGMPQEKLQTAARAGRPTIAITVAVALAVSLVALFALIPNRQSESRSVVSRPAAVTHEPGTVEQEVKQASQSASAASGTLETLEPSAVGTMASATDEKPATAPVPLPVTQPQASSSPSSVELARASEASQPKAPFTPGSVNFYDLAITKAGQESRLLEQILDEVGLKFDAATPIEPPGEQWESAFFASSFARETVVAVGELATEPMDEVILIYGHGKGKQNDLLAQALEGEPEVAVRKQFIWTSMDENGMGAEFAQLLQGQGQPLLRYQRDELKLLASLGELTWRFAAGASTDEPVSALYRIKLTSSWHSRSASALPKFNSPSRTSQEPLSRSASSLISELSGQGRGAAGREKQGEGRDAQTASRAKSNSVLNRPEPHDGPDGAVFYPDSGQNPGDSVIGADIQVEFLILVRYLRGNAS